MLIIVLVGGLLATTSCGQSEEELQQQQLEIEWQTERQGVIDWNNLITDIVNSIGQLVDWWNTIETDVNRQLDEGNIWNETASEQYEEQASAMRRNLGQLYAVLKSISYPESCHDAHLTLLQFLEKRQSEFTSIIAYESMYYEKDRLDANTKRNEANALWTQFILQYQLIKQEWDL